MGHQMNSAGGTHANLSPKTKNDTFFSLIFLDPGSGRKIPVIWHGAGANPGVLSQKPSTENGQFRVVGLRLAWLRYHRDLSKFIKIYLHDFSVTFGPYTISSLTFCIIPTQHCSFQTRYPSKTNYCFRPPALADPGT